jgi:pentatricopeptide repeat protein
MEEMRQAGVPPDDVTWNTLLKAYVDRSDLPGVRAVTEEMRVAGVQPNRVTFDMLLRACLEGSDFAEAQRLTEEMRKLGLLPDAFMLSALMQTYLDRSDLMGARSVMETMRTAGIRPDGVTWNMLLAAHANCPGDTLSAAEEVALKMEEDGLVLDAPAYSALIRCCFPGRTAAHPHHPRQAKHWFLLYVSSCRNRGPLHVGVANAFKKAVGYKAAADVCKNLGLDLRMLLQHSVKDAKRMGQSAKTKSSVRGNQTEHPIKSPTSVQCPRTTVT